MHSLVRKSRFSKAQGIHETGPRACAFSYENLPKNYIYVSLTEMSFMLSIPSTHQCGHVCVIRLAHCHVINVTNHCAAVAWARNLYRNSFPFRLR